MPLLKSNAPSSGPSPAPRFKLPNLISSLKFTTSAPVNIAYGPRQHSKAHRRSLSYDSKSSPELEHADRPFILLPSLPQVGNEDEDVSPYKSNLRDQSSSLSLPTNGLIRLSFAQCRRDIRWRQEGFEMSANASEDPTPFALRTQTLVPLSVAYSRDDIRRRNEAFEAPAVYVQPDEFKDVASNVRVSTPPQRPTNQAHSAATLAPPNLNAYPRNSTFSTFGPIYSRSIYARPSFARSADDNLSFLDDTVIAVYEEYGALSLYELGYTSAEQDSRASSPNAPPDNFLDMGFTSSSSGGCSAASI
ncbi:hypothetical protein GSI_10730 [Ganoderma sinense ZZ0214-1]|uniref:Uncharacterized protein n=1 Tax=Ganoderma sinense ZZ0214-1 TaxID=1077348 RepID=A0A2G8S1D4_9APHY|nr:hypothetical protein GSI_10730 [Ganoderma sinense ZZ0214-1]